MSFSVADLFDAYSSLSVPEITDIRDLIFKPKRSTRPGHICLIVRGPPGAGKTHCSKLIRVCECDCIVRNIFFPSSVKCVID